MIDYQENTHLPLINSHMDDHSDYINEQLPYSLTVPSRQDLGDMNEWYL